MATSSTNNGAEPVVLINKVLGARHITLNRPERLNALSHDMVKIILPNLLAWEKSELANVVILKGNGRALCSGGDVRDIIEYIESSKAMQKIITDEFRLLHTIATLDTPYVAIMDGITMGAGAAMCAHGGFRIATENTVFSMPETAIGLFTDVGSSFYMPRLDGQLGVYLALTGASLKAEDVLFSGIATHFVPSSRLPALESRLSELGSSNRDVVNTAIEEFSAEYNPKLRLSLGGAIRKTIDSCFKFNTVEEIIEALEKDGSDFALETKDTLLQRSPTAVKVTLQQMRMGASLSVAQCFKMEYRLLQSVAIQPDFKEGVTARLIKKVEPVWNPSTLAEVDNRTIRTKFFDTPGKQSLDLLSLRTFSQHPFLKYTLPTEDAIRRVVTGEDSVGISIAHHQTVLQHFVSSRQGKFGVREKVLDVLDRKTKGEQGQKLEWIYE
ncbi:mitochondrial 3-hydroxyisobutyryl-CoA hydrolase [Spinellus fusiger]|nr:mitochondrial 3-hydroxyisobutyryl-CoA hydrolase [Spinellus fusiger]